MPSGEMLLVLRVTTDPATGACYSMMAARNMPGDHKVWEVRAHELHKKPCKDPAFTAFTVNREGSEVITVGGGTSSGTESWKRWCTATGELLATGPRHDMTDGCECHPDTATSLCPKLAHVVSVTAVAFSPKGSFFATGDRFGLVITWNAATGGGLVQMHNIHASYWVDIVSISSDEELLASGSQEKVFLWAAGTGLLLRAFDLDPAFSSLTSMCFPPINPDHIVIHHGSSYETRNAKTGELIRAQHAYGFAALSPDGRTMATTDKLDRQPPTWDSNNQLVRLIDTDTGVDRARLELDGPREFGKVAFSPKGDQFIALVSGDAAGHSYRVYDSSTGAVLRRYKLTGRMEECTIAWTPNKIWATERNTAFAMGYHERLGVQSWIIKLDKEVIRLILDQ